MYSTFTGPFLPTRSQTSFLSVLPGGVVLAVLNLFFYCFLAVFIALLETVSVPTLYFSISFIPVGESVVANAAGELVFGRCSFLHQDHGYDKIRALLAVLAMGSTDFYGHYIASIHDNPAVSSDNSLFQLDCIPGYEITWLWIEYTILIRNIHRGLLEIQLVLRTLKCREWSSCLCIHYYTLGQTYPVCILHGF